MRLLLSIFAILTMVSNGTCVAADSEPLPASFDYATGKELMEAVYQRHQQYPYVYEEQSMILIDRHGHRDTRKLRRYSRVAESGESNFLLLFDSPLDVKGVALLARREKSGEVDQSFYLPAFGRSFVRNIQNNSQEGDNFLGTDFSVENLVGEMLDDSMYVLLDDEVIDEVTYHVIDVHSPDDTETLRVPRRRRGPSALRT